MDRRANSKLAVISFLTVVGTANSTLVLSRGLMAQEAPSQKDVVPSLSAKPTGVAKPDLTIAVRVYDYVQAPDAVVNAQEVASRIFREAGIKVVWHDCMSADPKSLDGSACAQEVGPAGVVLRIVPQIKVIPGIHRDTNLGFTAGLYATISFSRVLELAHEVSNPPFLILGRAMAHEIGHVLLPGMPHSPEGIMRACWGGRNLKVAAANDMSFSDTQSKALQAAVQMRVSQSEAPQISRVAAPK